MPSVAPITVVLVHRNSVESIRLTLHAFRGQTVATELLVVDSGSEHDIESSLRSLVEADELIAVGHNVGFGPGANVGLRRWLRESTGEWCAIAPHDALPDPDTLEKILDAVKERPFVGLVSADVGDPGRPIIEPFLGPIDAPATGTGGLEFADYPHGTLMLVRRRCIEEVGLFDERYFAYCEEAELALRARAAGWQSGIVRGAMVHNPGMSTNVERVAYLQHRNTLLMLREHFGRWNAWFRLGMALIQLPIGLVYPRARGLHWSPTGRLKGIRDFVRGHYGPPARDVRGA